MPGIGSATTGVWVLQGHLFLSYLTETKCMELSTYSEVSVADFAFAACASLHVSYYNSHFLQVTKQETRSRDFVLVFPCPATAAEVSHNSVYACLTSSQLYRSELKSSAVPVVVDIEAEATALHVTDGKVLAGLATNKVLILHDDLQGEYIATIDLNPAVSQSIPNDIL